MSDETSMRGEGIWVVRAGQGGMFIEDFRRNSLVAVGWGEIGLLPERFEDLPLRSLFANRYPSAGAAARGSWMGQLKRFTYEIQVGDPVATYDPHARVYLIGHVTSSCGWRDAPLPRFRRVLWAQQVPRHSLSVDACHALGSITAVFRVRPSAAAEFVAKAKPIQDEHPTI